MISKTGLDKIFEEVYSEYPEEFHWLLRDNETRIKWQVEVVIDKFPNGGVLLDIGAGLVPFMYICQKLGYETVVVDDLEDDTCKKPSLVSIIDLFESSGIRFIKADAFTEEFDSQLPISIDMVTTHDSMEHWHNSPKTLFEKLWSRVNDGGILWIGVPNCVNLRKRITVPFGYGKWSRMEDWYEPKVFRGHVREPDVEDLRYISKSLGATTTEILGKNWIGYRHSNKYIKKITPFVDRAIQFFPSICSDIYLLAKK